MTYQFRLPIGDWSGDGHSMCEYFIISSNKPFSAVKKAYSNAEKLLPEAIWPTSICNEYQESVISKETQLLLMKHGPQLSFLVGGVPEDADEAEYPLRPEEMVEIVLWFLIQGDTNLELSIQDPPMDMLIADHKTSGRSQFGYGLFD